MNYNVDVSLKKYAIKGMRYTIKKFLESQKEEMKQDINMPYNLCV